jgi:hypothetical protein
VTIRRHRRDGRTATLACGVVAEYEAPDLVPAAGDVVPCRNHGHCSVVSRGTGVREGTVVNRQRRSQVELMAHLQRRGTATLRALRGERFSLRLIAEAEKAGRVHVDLLAGVVTVRTAAWPRRASEHEPSTTA